MATPDTRSEMLRLLRSHREGFSLEQPFYQDRDFFQADHDLNWHRDSHFAGHDSEVPAAGHYMTLQVGTAPVVIVRDRAGKVRAFHNSCRHRGSRVVTAEKGRAGTLVCGYHQWTYDLGGQLVNARDMGEGFDKCAHSLKPIACESVAGYLFICLADAPADFGPMRARMEPYFAPHRLGEAKVAYESTIIEKGNWKLVWENNRECYHCHINHPELVRTFPEAPTVTGVNGADSDPALTAHWQRCEEAGLPSKFFIDPAGQFRVARAPLLGDSYTMEGTPAVSRGLSDSVTLDRIGTLLLFHYPTTWNHVLGDHAVTFRVLPISATETAVTTKWLVHKDAVEGVDYDLERLTHVWKQTNDQDRRIVEENARGIASPAYRPGPYSPVHEDGVQQFVEWYCATVRPRLEDATAQSAASKVIRLAAAH